MKLRMNCIRATIIVGHFDAQVDARSGRWQVVRPAGQMVRFTDPAVARYSCAVTSSTLSLLPRSSIPCGRHCSVTERHESAQPCGGTPQFILTSTDEKKKKKICMQMRCERCKPCDWCRRCRSTVSATGRPRPIWSDPGESWNQPSTSRWPVGRFELWKARGSRTTWRDLRHWSTSRPKATIPAQAPSNQSTDLKNCVCQQSRVRSWVTWLG